THPGLLPDNPALGGADDPEVATSGPGPSRTDESANSMPGVVIAGQLNGPSRPTGKTGWAVWSHSAYSPALILLIELIAFGAVAVSAITVRSNTRDLINCAVIIGLGLLAAELARQVERRRRRFADTPHVNFSSVWTLAGAL